MSQHLISVSARHRETPFTRRVNAAGVKCYSVYNHMLLPVFFDSVEADYRHLKDHVQVWDVACERQVEIIGPDAAKLMQILTPRDLRTMTVGQCRYIPVVDEKGGMLNDPVAVKLADDRYWVSIADSDLLFWVKGLAAGFGLDVNVFEPDVSPLAVQGPKADDLMARVFGEGVRDIRFFRFERFEFEGVSLCIARSGYSKQGGFEIYVDGTALGEPLWDALFAAGADLNVRAGGPNLIERVEGGLLSYGGDITQENNPFECGLGKFCTIDEDTVCVGREALAEIAKTGPSRQIRSLAIDGDPLVPTTAPWPVLADGAQVGRVSVGVWSPDHRTNVALGIVDRSHWADGTRVIIATPDGERMGLIREKSFL